MRPDWREEERDRQIDRQREKKIIESENVKNQDVGLVGLILTL